MKEWREKNKENIKIIENNKLIAEFVGDKFITEVERGYDYMKNCWHHSGNYYNKLEYHTSWDWLMSVVDKICSLGFEFTIDGRSCTITPWDEDIPSTTMWFIDSFNGIHTAIYYKNELPVGGSSLLEITCKASLLFINWYNDHKIMHDYEDNIDFND